MPTEVQQQVASLLLLPLLWLLPAVIVALFLAARARRTTGRTIALERPLRIARLALLVGPQALVLAIVIARGDLMAAAASDCLALGILLAWLSPGSNDAVCGEDGVQRGWYARRFEELEEWRLTGQHLRFKLFGEWTSVPLPPAEQPRVREKLALVNAAGESRFQE